MVDELDHTANQRVQMYPSYNQEKLAKFHTLPWDGRLYTPNRPTGQVASMMNLVIAFLQNPTGRLPHIAIPWQTCAVSEEHSSSDAQAEE